jgi:hypothetical protein
LQEIPGQLLQGASFQRAGTFDHFIRVVKVFLNNHIAYAEVEGKGV